MHTPSPSPTAPKTEWREWALAARQTRPLLALAQALREAVTPLLSEARHVLLYAATASEMDLLPLATCPETQFYLPRCAPKRRLAIHAYPAPLVLSPFGIREPEATAPELDPVVLDLVLVPALVLDRDGYRLGYGGGYYDRLLPRLRPECRTIGVSSLLVERLPRDPWDIPVSLLPLYSTPAYSSSG